MSWTRSSLLGGSLLLALGGAGCGGPAARGFPVGLHGHGRYHSASPAPLPRDTVAVEAHGSGDRGDGAELGRYLAFIRRQRAALLQPAVTVEERREGHAALDALVLWAAARTEAELQGDDPLEVYLRLKVRQAQALREAAARSARVEAKLEEFHRWADARSLERGPHEEARRARVDTVLDWAYSHTRDPDFLRKDPGEVAVRLLGPEGPSSPR
jgi:hypothetical protein